MREVIGFFGSAGQVGVTMTARSVADAYAERGEETLLISASGKYGNDYVGKFDTVRSLDDLKADIISDTLKPEEMTAVEAGVRYASGGVSATLSVYRHWGRNMIDWIMDASPGGDGVWTSVNHARINSTGVEADARLDFRRVAPSQRVLRSLNVAYAYIDQSQRREQGVLSMYALEYLRHKVVAALGLDILPGLGLDVSYRFQEREGTYTDTEGITRTYRPYSLVDARLAWHKPRYSVYVEANNLLDTYYVDYGNVPQPGLWIIAGAKWNFSF